MDSPLFLNPFTNPLFDETVLWLAIGYLLSFIGLIIGFKGDFQRLFSENVGKRYLGWLIITPLYLIGIFCGRIPGIIMVTALILVAVWEAVKITKLTPFFYWLLVILTLATVTIADVYPSFFYSMPLFYFSLLSYMSVRLNDPKKSFWHATVSLFIAVWIIFGLSHLILLGRLNNTLDQSRSLLVLVIFAVCLSDIGSYVVGKLFKKLNILQGLKIADNISPNKTYFGVLGQILGALIGIGIFYFAIHRYLPVHHWIIIGILIGIFSASGGMINSMFKRYFEVKDSGTIIPGHGGVLDRADSLIRVIIVIYYYFSIVLHH